MTRALLSSATIAVLIGSGVLLPAQESTDAIAKIFDRIEDSRGAYLWQGIRELESLGRGSLDDIRKGRARANGFVRIAAAKILYGKEFRKDALDTLKTVIDGKNSGARRAAARLAAYLVAGDASFALTEKEKLARDFEARAAEATEPATQVAFWRSAWKLTGRFRVVRQVSRIHAGATDRTLKEETALVLAEMGRLSDARPTLQELSREPSERGRVAQAYLKLDELSRDIDRRAGEQSRAEPKYDFKMLEEAIDILKARYHDEKKIDPKKLIEEATRGAVSSLDPYTTYMDEKAIHTLIKERLPGEYGGIGARVSMRKDKNGNSWLTIEEPIFSGPAYKSGLRSYDRITEVEGESTANRELWELVQKLRGKEGTEVKFKVYRRGWTKERDYAINRGKIGLETTTHRMLPGNIGYIQLVTFGPYDTDRVKEAIEKLKGMKALIFDLRGNSGGYLRTAHRIASYFLNRGDLIVSTRGRGVEQDRRVADGKKLIDVPIAILVNQGSASASEILAGALQDHKRAVLIGEKTFGKGSVQDMERMKSTGKKTAIKVTISKWYLPSGRTVEGEKRGDGGVVPDFKAGLPERDFWRDAEFEKLRERDEIHSYVKENWDKELFSKLAESDGGKTSPYPEFDALYKKLGTRVEKDDLRALLRQIVRKRVQDDRGKPLYFDFQTDTVLQRGILEACKLAKLDPASIAEYGTFVKPESGKTAKTKK